MRLFPFIIGTGHDLYAYTYVAFEEYLLVLVSWLPLHVPPSIVLIATTMMNDFVPI